MESVTNQENSVEAQTKKGSAPQGDRITLGKDESMKLDSWIQQIELKTNGMVKLTRSELVNYLLQRKDAELSLSELNQIRKDNYDEVKFAYRALSKIKEAKKSGESITLEDLMRVQRGLVKPPKESASRDSAVNAKKSARSGELRPAPKSDPTES